MDTQPKINDRNGLSSAGLADDSAPFITVNPALQALWRGGSDSPGADCLPPYELERYALGELKGLKRRNAGLHLVDCKYCRSRYALVVSGLTHESERPALRNVVDLIAVLRSSFSVNLEATIREMQSKVSVSGKGCWLAYDALLKRSAAVSIEPKLRAVLGETRLVLSSETPPPSNEFVPSSVGDGGGPAWRIEAGGVSLQLEKGVLSIEASNNWLATNSPLADGFIVGMFAASAANDGEPRLSLIALTKSGEFAVGRTCVPHDAVPMLVPDDDFAFLPDPGSFDLELAETVSACKEANLKVDPEAAPIWETFVAALPDALREELSLHLSRPSKPGRALG